MTTTPFPVAPSPPASRDASFQEVQTSEDNQAEFEPLLREAMDDDASHQPADSADDSSEQSAAVVATAQAEPLQLVSSQQKTPLPLSAPPGQQAVCQQVSIDAIQEQGLANLSSTGTTDNKAELEAIHKAPEIQVQNSTETGRPREAFMASANSKGIENHSEAILANQIRDILNQAGMDQRVVITRADKNIQNSKELPSFHITQTVQGETVKTSIAADSAMPIGLQIQAVVNPSESNSNRLEGLRHHFGEQFLHAKIDQAGDKGLDGEPQGNSSSDQQGNGQGNQFGRQQGLSSMFFNGAPLNTEAVSSATFSETLSSATPSALSYGTQGHSTFIPPVPQGEIVNHLVERFANNPRLQTSKLTLQLHPAELGELKINIMVEGDAIKANIGVQTLQVQELIDRNMNKLRTVLEEQGFIVEDFQITLNSDTGDQLDFFQEGFQSMENFADDTRSQQNEDEFDLTLESTSVDLDETQHLNPNDEESGINVTV
ncbi:MAG: flagellar hook-length control protein FliK [Thermodesulfobacteriota bacterium]